MKNHETLLLETALNTGEIDQAMEIVVSASSVSYADQLTEVNILRDQIATATDPNLIRNILIELPEEAFIALNTSGELPSQFQYKYAVLNQSVSKHIFSQLTEVAAARAKLRQEQLERERIAAEAARKAEQERKLREIAAAEAKRKEERTSKIETCFSAWDGSHRGLTKLIKASMNNPKSYEHVNTVYWDMGDYLVVKTTFRGTNAFGGVVINWVKAQVDLEGNVLQVLEQGP